MIEWLKVAHTVSHTSEQMPMNPAQETQDEVEELLEILDQDLEVEPDYIVELDADEEDPTEEEADSTANELHKPSVPLNPERMPRFGQHDAIRFIYRPRDGPEKRPILAYQGRRFSYKDFAQGNGKVVGWRWQCCTKNCWTTLQTDFEFQSRSTIVQHKNFCQPNFPEIESKYLEGFICMAARHAPSTDHKQIYVELASFKENHPDYAYNSLKSFASMSSQLARSHTGVNRNEFGEIDIQGDYLTRVGSGPNSMRFLLYDEKVADERLIIYASDFCLRLLANAEVWMADGTFKAAPKNFYQVYRIRILATYLSDASFPPKTWSVFNRHLFGLPTTNNYLESSNRSLNAALGGKAHHFNSVVKFLKEEHATTQIRIEAMIQDNLQDETFKKRDQAAFERNRDRLMEEMTQVTERDDATYATCKVELHAYVKGIAKCLEAKRNKKTFTVPSIVNIIAEGRSSLNETRILRSSIQLSDQ
ncbi:hypothetical protein Ciccas_012613 [Cichlidogyrus casuarinus]|uniref:MULE transposase domain-containing protein n=1 Tax=Cichlidogyrus casuarinus TaxID=1844966 RepID=A0ABD2PMY8_9PLAT